jgi:hypothetical protein
MSSSRLVKRLLGLAAALVMMLAAQAQASYNPVGNGSTAITFSSAFSKSLAQNQVKVQVHAGAKKAGRSIVLPAAAGEVDPRLGTGTVESSGTIVFVAGKRRVPFRDIVFKAKRAPLYAKVAGNQLKIASGARLASERSGFGVDFEVANLRLTSKVATRLNKKLRLGKALTAGLPLGRITVKTSPATVHLREEGRLSLAVDPAFFAKLDKLFVSLNPIAPTELTAGPVLSFPVGPESTLAPDGHAGTVKLGGSVELLQLGTAQVFWREVWLEAGAGALLAEVDAEPSPPYAGKQAQGGLLALPSGGTFDSEPAVRTIGLTGQSAVLTEASAATLNAAFAKGEPRFAGGESVGTLSMSVTAE